ncbi:hypothetical protein N185_30585 [Sinorhizobium sp. GW3]|nr:hypothetical protein N185_30585 [Sinorhizobium sp. GW3]
MLWARTYKIIVYKQELISSKTTVKIAYFRVNVLSSSRSPGR